MHKYNKKKFKRRFYPPCPGHHNKGQPKQKFRVSAVDSSEGCKRYIFYLFCLTHRHTILVFAMYEFLSSYEGRKVFKNTSVAEKT